MSRATALGKRVVAEAAGTFLLVVIGAGSVVLDERTGGALGNVVVSLAFGVAVAAAVYAFARVSGAHINPAVTLGFWSARRFPGREVAPYLAAQCVGAVTAAVVVVAVLGSEGRAGATIPRVSLPSALLTEFLLSFLLMLAIASVTNWDPAGRGVASVVIGATVGFDAFLGGPSTGASMNPRPLPRPGGCVLGLDGPLGVLGRPDPRHACRDPRL